MQSALYMMIQSSLRQKQSTEESRSSQSAHHDTRHDILFLVGVPLFWSPELSRIEPWILDGTLSLETRWLFILKRQSCHQSDSWAFFISQKISS